MDICIINDAYYLVFLCPYLDVEFGEKMGNKASKDEMIVSN
jgi:hypothetical protein